MIADQLANPDQEISLATPTQWEQIETRPSRVITAFASARDADQHAVIFSGSAAGIWASRDVGRTWNGLNHDPELSPVSSVAISSNYAHNRTLFIGTAKGVFRSTDGGRSFQSVLAIDNVLAVAIAPNDESETTPSPDLVFAGAEADGAFCSRDNGHGWTTANAGLLDLAVLALAFSPAFMRDRTGFAATASGLYRTRNGGKAWRWSDLGGDEPAVQCLALSPGFGADGLVFTGTEDDGLWRSDDAGETWMWVAAVDARNVTSIAFSSSDQVIAAATENGIVLTEDGGTTWKRCGDHLGAVLSLGFVLDDGRDILLAGLAGRGIARSENNGALWSDSSLLIASHDDNGRLPGRPG